MKQMVKTYSSDLIKLNRGWQLNHWCEELNLRADELIEVVRKVGPSLKEIRTYLQKKKATP